MYKIVTMSKKDIPVVLLYATEFGQGIDEEVNTDHYRKQWERFFDSGIGVMWGLSCDGVIVGGIGGIIAPDLHSGKATLIELFWYVSPAHRKHGLKLFNEMEKYANDHNLRWAMIHMENSMPDKLKEFYRKQGFRLLETHWIRDPIGGTLCQ